MNSETKKTTLVSRPKNPHSIDLGMGFNWFDHLGAGGYYARWENYPLDIPTYPDLSDTKAWSEIERGLDELGLEWIRFGFPPNAHVDEEGHFIRDTVHIQRLIWLNNWATKRGKTILIDPFMMPFYYEFPLPEGVTEPGSQLINMAAEDNRAYARNFVAPLFLLLIHELKMDSVRYFNPINEPMEYGVYQTPNDTPPAIVHYVEMYREIRAALDDIGIDRNRVGLVGIDGSFPVKILLDQLIHGVDIDEVLDAYAVHHYDLKLDYLPTKKFPEKPTGYFNNGIRGAIELNDAQLLAYCRDRQKPLWALEMGTFYYGKFENPEGVATVDACLTVSEAIIRAVNMGITTFCIWSLMNPNTVDGHWAVISVKDQQLIKHPYPFAFYALLSHHIPAGASVYPLKDIEDPEIGHVHGTILENGAARSVLVVNDHPSEANQVSIQLPEEWPGDLEYEVVVSSRERLLESEGSVKAAGRTLTLNVPPFTLIGLKNSSG